MTVEEALNSTIEYINYLAVIGAATDEEVKEQITTLQTVLKNLPDDELTKQMC